MYEGFNDRNLSNNSLEALFSEDGDESTSKIISIKNNFYDLSAPNPF